MASQWAPTQTPQPIRYLIAVTCAISLLSALTNNVIIQLLHVQGPQELLGLSWPGIRHGYFWQLISYMFVGNVGSYGIDVSYLLSLFFAMYILWTIGAMVLERIGVARFFTLYFGAGIVAGLLGLWGMTLTGHYTTLAGLSAPLLALFTVWTMYYPDSIVMLFFIIPTQPKWILAGIVGALGIISVIQEDVVNLFFYFGSIFFGYFFGLLILNLYSPFDFTHSFDRKIIQWVSGVRKGKRDRSKTIDISTGESFSSDDEFVDQMLTKISKSGERSLTAKERRRMEQISERKMREHKDD